MDLEAEGVSDTSSIRSFDIYSLRTSVDTGHNTSKTFVYDIVESLQPPQVKGLDRLGYAGSCVRRYREPQTVRSSTFSEFLLEKGSVLETISPFDGNIFTQEFKPPRLQDFVSHLERFGSRRPCDDMLILSSMGYLLEKVRSIEGGTTGNIQFHDWLTTSNLMRVRVPKSTSAGVRFSVLGMRTKGEALASALTETGRIIEGMKDGVLPILPPCVPAGRGKVDSILSDDGGKQGRLILMPDLCRHLLGSMTSVPYSKFNKDVEKIGGGSLIGMGPFGSWYSRVADLVNSEPWEFMMTVDFSGFDQTVPASILHVAMEHIKSKFVKCDGSEVYWANEVKQLINTEIAMPNGDVYVKERGVASGDPWTSQAGSLAHWMMWLIFFKENSIKGRAWTFGDDGIVAFGKGVSSDGMLDRVTEFFYDKFGLEVKASASYVSRVLIVKGPYPVEGASVKFLSNFFMEKDGAIVPVPPTESAFKGLLLPERNPEVDDPNFMANDNYDYEIQRATAYYVLFYFNDPAREMISMYIEFLRNLRNPGEPTVDLQKIAAELTRLDFHGMNFNVEWTRRLPTDTEIVELYRYGRMGRYLMPEDTGRPPGSNVGWVLGALVLNEVYRGLGRVE